jgi:integrase
MAWCFRSGRSSWRELRSGALGLVGKGNERDRRPTQDELDCLVAGFEFNPYQKIPVGRIIRFAVATAMRQDEISRIEWADFDPQKKMLLVRDRKDPNPSARRHTRAASFRRMDNTSSRSLQRVAA